MISFEEKLHPPSSGPDTLALTAPIVTIAPWREMWKNCFFTPQSQHMGKDLGKSLIDGINC